MFTRISKNLEEMIIDCCCFGKPHGGANQYWRTHWRRHPKMRRKDASILMDAFLTIRCLNQNTWETPLTKSITYTWIWNAEEILLNQAIDYQNVWQFQCSALLCKYLRNFSVPLEGKKYEGMENMVLFINCLRYKYWKKFWFPCADTSFFH